MISVSGYCGATLKSCKFVSWNAIPEGKKKGIGAEKIFEDRMVENVPNLVKDVNLQIKVNTKQDKFKIYSVTL